MSQGRGQPYPLCGRRGLRRRQLEYVGFATGAKRAELYGGAIATFVPTTYIEPFGAVAIESRMTGTPAITTDWGTVP